MLRCTGVAFVEYLEASGYSVLLHALGNTLHDLLANLDLIYSHLEPFYPDMRAPSFRCVANGDGALHFHFRSHRTRRYSSFVVGIVTSLARRLFKLEIDMQEVDTVDDVTRDTATSNSDVIDSEWIIRDRKSIGLGARRRSTSFISSCNKFRISSNPKDLSLSTSALCDAFPFHFIVSRHMLIVQAGRSLQRLLTSRQAQAPVKMSDVFQIEKPTVTMSFSSLLCGTSSVFQLKLLTAKTETVVRLQGQAIYMPESDCVLFMCSPRVQHPAQLRAAGLRLVQLPLYGSARRLFFVSQGRRLGRALVLRCEETHEQLLQMQQKLQQEREETDRLLHSMLPEHVSSALRLKQPFGAERFERVTVLCSDIVNFTALCGHDGVGPMDVIRILNKLYTNFDVLTTIHSVFKVNKPLQSHHSTPMQHTTLMSK